MFLEFREGKRLLQIRENLRNITLFSLFLFCLACSSDPQITYQRFDSPRMIERGKYLVQGPAACGFCHSKAGEPGGSLTGGRELHDRYGPVMSPNITPHESGIGSWTPQEVMRAIRSSIGKDEKLLSKQVHLGYSWLSESDLFSILAYLEHLQPEENSVERRSPGSFSKYTTGLFETHREMKGYVPEILPTDEKAYGKYLVDHVARCGSCHNGQESLFSDPDYLVGGRELEFDGTTITVPALVGSENSLSEWGQDDIKEFLSSGQRPDGTTVNPAHCPVDFFARATDKDMHMMATYLGSLD